MPSDDEPLVEGIAKDDVLGALNLFSKVPNADVPLVDSFASGKFRPEIGKIQKIDKLLS